jgi:thiamine biosynthesis lipoprotein
VAWRIAVETPTAAGRSVQRVVQPGDQGVATSGDYRNFREVDGKRYSHTIDPATGRPVEHSLASVTVLHPSAMVADGLATGLMVMGPERGMAFAETEHLPVLMLVRAGDGFQERASSAFETALR